MWAALTLMFALCSPSQDSIEAIVAELTSLALQVDSLRFLRASTSTNTSQMFKHVLFGTSLRVVSHSCVVLGMLVSWTRLSL